jgi:hypothetical protein
LPDTWLRLRTSYTQSLSMGPSHGIYGGMGAAQVNRRYTPILYTITLFFFLLAHTHMKTERFAQTKVTDTLISTQCALHSDLRVVSQLSSHCPLSSIMVNS